MDISSAEEVVTLLIKIVKEIGELSSTNAESRLSDAGIDSFTSLLLSAQVQKIFGVKFPEINLSNSVQTFALEIFNKMFNGSDSEETQESNEEVEVKEEEKEKVEPVHDDDEEEEQQQLIQYFVRKAAATHKEQVDNHVLQLKNDSYPSNQNFSMMVENGVNLSLMQKNVSSVSASSILHSQSSFANHFVEDTEIINSDMVSDENLLEPTMEMIGCFGKVKRFGGGTGAKISIDSHMTKEDARKWCHVSHPKSNPLKRIFCFTWAGGTTAVFKEQCWEQDPNTEIVRIVLPGREMRREEGSQNFDIKVTARFVVKAMETLEYFESKRSSSPSQTKETDDIYVRRFPTIYVLGTSYGAYVGLEALRLLKNSHYATNIGGFFPVTIEPPNVRKRNGLTVRWTLGLLWRINNTFRITGKRKLVRVDYQAWNTELLRKNLFDDIEYMDKYYIPLQVNIKKPNSNQYQIDRVLGDIPFHVIKAENDDISNESNMNYWAEYTRGESQFYTIKDALHLIFLKPSTNEAVADLVFSILSNENN
jgi:surfactin synthase thioesterase subunit/acyl carrier protein